MFLSKGCDVTIVKASVLEVRIEMYLTFDDKSLAIHVDRKLYFDI